MKDTLINNSVSSKEETISPPKLKISNFMKKQDVVVGTRPQIGSKDHSL